MPQLAKRADKYTVLRSVSTLNKPGSLGSISTVVGKQGGNITDVRIGRRATDIYEMLLDVEVESLDPFRLALTAADYAGLREALTGIVDAFESAAMTRARAGTPPAATG